MPRVDIAVDYVDGKREVVKVGRPADLIAFADTFRKGWPEGPDALRELAWLVHRALRIDTPLEEWLDTLDELEPVREPKAVAPEPAPELAAAGDRQPAPAAARHAPPAPAPDPPDRTGLDPPDPVPLRTPATPEGPDSVTRIGSTSPA